MKYLLPLALFAAACSPSIGYDDNPASTNNPTSPSNPAPYTGGAPSEQVALYNKMHSDIDYTTENIIRQMENRSDANPKYADEGMKTIQQYVVKMSYMAAENYRDQIAAYGPKYKSIHDKFKSGMWTTRTLLELRNVTQELRNNFGAHQIMFAMDVVPATSPDGPNPTNPRVPTDVGTTDVKNITPWIFFKAWKASHDDLVDAIKNDGDAQKFFDRVIKAIEYMRDNTTAIDRPSLMLYKGEYDRVYRETNGFKNFTGSLNKEGALRDLGIVGSSVNDRFNPDRK